MPGRVPRVRSALFVPGGRADFLAKADQRGADAVILDLEDSVADGKLDEARTNVGRWIATRPGPTNPVVCVRINALDEGCLREDLAAIVHEGEKWHGYNLLCRAATAALETTLRAKTGGDRPLEGRTVMLLGATPMTRVLAERIGRQGGIPIIAISAGPDTLRVLLDALGKALEKSLEPALLNFGRSTQGDSSRAAAGPGQPK